MAGDYLVTYEVLVTVRVENADDPEQAKGIADDYTAKSGLTGQRLIDVLRDAVDPTEFFVEGYGAAASVVPTTD